MKPALIIGIILIILGVVALVYQGVPFAEQHRADLGPVRLTATEHKTFPIPPVLGIVVLAGGIVLVVIGARKS